MGGSRYALIAALLALSSAAFAIELEHDRYSNPKVGLQFAVPHGWSLTRQTGYPPLLAILTSAEHPGSEITIAHAAWNQARQMASLVRSNDQALRALGLRIISSGAITHLGRRIWRTRASWQSNKGALEIQQIYLASAGQAVFIVTASAPKIDRIFPDVDMLVESLEVDSQSADL